jgi:hypothetical protein
MISKKQKMILWVCYVLLIIFSAAGVGVSFIIKNMIPMALNDSSPNFGQIADDDRWAVYHQAQSLMVMVISLALVVMVLWAALAAFSIWLVGKKSHQS